MAGAKSGQNHVDAPDLILHQSADTYCKLQELGFEDCADCGGSGELWISHWEPCFTTCANCHGSGKVRKETDAELKKGEGCPKCGCGCSRSSSATVGRFFCVKCGAETGGPSRMLIK